MRRFVHVSETLNSRVDKSVLVPVYLVNMCTTPPSYDSWGLSVGGDTSSVHTEIIWKSVQWKPCKRISIIPPLFVLILRAHTRRRGRTPLWAKWTASAERAAAWTSGYRSSTCLSDEPAAAQTCERTCTSPAQGKWCEPCWTSCHPEIKFQSTADGERKCWGGNKRPCCLHGMYLKEEEEGRWMDFHFGQDCLKFCLSAFEVARFEKKVK